MGAEQVECASFTSDAPGFSHAGDGERAESEAIAGDVHGVLADKDKAKTSGEFCNRFFDCFAQSICVGTCNFVEENFGVRRCLENMSVGFHFGAKLVSVGDVSVVCNGNLSPFAAHENRLCVCECGCACGTVTYVAYARKTLQFVNIVFPQERGNKPHGFSDSYFIAVCNSNACAFLAAVL